MQHRIARPLACRIGAVALGAALAGCTAADNPTTIFADPGKYQYFTCEQLVGQRSYWSGREKELQQLMDKAGESTGGGIVGVLAYKADKVQAAEELKVVESTARAKSCADAENWRSNSVVR
jgi:hypothetical protein